MMVNRALLIGGALAISLPVFAATPASWGRLTPGRFAVGYEGRYILDPTRAFATNTRSRPIQLRIWYPARRSTGRPVRVSDYQKLSAAASMTNVADEFMKRDRGIHQYVAGKYFKDAPPGLTEKISAMPMFARNGASMTGSRYPLVVYAGGANLSTDENVLLWEFLASHGYVVAAVPTQGMRSVEFNADGPGLETLARDLEVAIASARERADVDDDKLAATGFSFGGAAAFLVAMRNPGVRAVVAYDSSIIGVNYVKFLRASPFFDATATTASLLEFHRRDPSTVVYETLDSVRYARRDSFELPDLEHVDFTSLPSLAAAARGLHDDSPSISYKRAAFEAMAQRTLEFLDETLKGVSSQISAPLMIAAATPLQIEGRRRSSLPVPPDREQLLRTIEQRGIDAAEQSVRDLRRSDPEAAILSERSINTLGYELIEAKRADDAIRVMQWNVDAHPSSTAAYDGLADAFQAKGDLACAADAYRKLLDVVSRDETTPPETRESLAKNAAERLPGLPASGCNRSGQSR